MQGVSKYDFRGYRLLKATVSRVKDKPITSFSLFSQKGVYNEENKIFELISEISVTFGEEVNVFVFSAGFKINDAEWYEVMAEQTVINEFFAMFMFINIDKLTIEFNDFVDELVTLGKSKGLEIHVMHEDIFNLMHKI